MTTKLQQVIARSKVATLDDKLRSVAEQVLRDKFDVKTPDKDTSSPSSNTTESPTCRRTIEDIFNSPTLTVSDRGDIYSPIVEVDVPVPSIDCISESIRLARNATRTSRRVNMFFEADPLFFDRLSSLGYTLTTDTIAVSGIMVKKQRGIRGCRLIAEVLW